MPAKKQTMNIIQFNRHFGCPKCKQPGEHVPSGRGQCHAYLYQENNPSGPARTHAETKSDTEKAYRTNEAVNGIKVLGFFILCPMLSEDMPLTTCIKCYIGIIHQLLRLWFNSSSIEVFNISKHVHEADKRLSNLPSVYQESQGQSNNTSRTEKPRSAGPGYSIIQCLYCRGCSQRSFFNTICYF